MLRSKYFWIAIVILIPFIVVWVMYGIAWALGMLGMLAILFLFVSGNRRRRAKRYIVYEENAEDYDEDEEEVIIVEGESERRSKHSEWVRDLYLPKGLRNIHQDGLNELGQRQRESLNQSLRRLRRLR